MCGRFSLTTSIERISEHFSLIAGFSMRPRFNIAPGEYIPVIKQQGQVEFLSWGFIPNFLKSQNKGSPIINARSETLLEKPAFRNALKMRRCLILADGFYEWKSIGRIKQPYYVHYSNNEPFAIAAIWEGESVAIITQAAVGSLAEIHNRMPLIIDRKFYSSWLNSKASLANEIQPLLTMAESSGFKIIPVSTKVNHTNFDHPECILSLS